MGRGPDKKFESQMLAKNLANMAKEHSLTVRQLAEIADTSKSNIQNWLSGHQASDYEALLKLCNYFRVSLAWLLTGKCETYQSIVPISSMFRSEETLFDGYAHIVITKLSPRLKKGNDG